MNSLTANIGNVLTNKIKEILPEFMKTLDDFDLKNMDFEEIEELVKMITNGFGGAVLENLILRKCSLTLLPKNVTKKNDKNKEYSLTYKRTVNENISTIYGEIKLSCRYYYNHKYKEGCIRNNAGLYETDGISPGLKKLLGINSIHFSDMSSVDYIYQLLGINVGDKKVLKIRQELSEYANKWTEKKEIIPKGKNPREHQKMALAIDEGKVHIRSEKKNEVTGKYDYFWKNIKMAVAYPFDEKGKKCGQALYSAGITENLEIFEQSLLKSLIKASGFDKAFVKATLSDGANGYENLLKSAAKNAYHILDIIHAKEHLWILAKILYPDTIDRKINPQAIKWVNDILDVLFEKGGKNLITNLDIFKKQNHLKSYKKQVWEKETNYFKKNIDRIDYNIYKLNNLPIGSGIVESAVKYISNKRLKINAPCWLQKNVDGLLKLRTIWFNKLFPDFWKWRSRQLKYDYLKYSDHYAVA